MDWNEIWNVILEFLKTFGIKILISGICVIVGIKLIKWLKKWIKTSPKFSKVEDGARSFIASLVVVLLYIVLFITVAMILGIPTTSFIAALASVFAAIGLAMQGSLSNFAGGVMILIFKPFKVGDYIVAPKEEAEGTVMDISLVYTVLRTFDNQEVTIPNGTLTNSVVRNLTTAQTRRVDLAFSTSYDCDVDMVKDILMNILKNHSKVLSDPEPTARLNEHGDSALVFSVKAWCDTDDYWDVRYDLIEAVKKEFDNNGISIPYPQLDVHFDKQASKK